MSGLAPYLVGYVFRVLWRECHPSDLPEVICTRLVGVQAITPLYEDEAVGVREYRVNAHVDAESGERAVEIVHRWFAHLPGCTVIKFAAQPLTPGSLEPVFTSSNACGDLFAPTESAAAPSSLTPRSEFPLWSGVFLFRLDYTQTIAANILSRSGFERVQMEENLGGAVVVSVVLEFDCKSSADGVAEEYGWTVIADKLVGVNFEKRSATLSHRIP